MSFHRVLVRCFAAMGCVDQPVRLNRVRPKQCRFMKKANLVWILSLTHIAGKYLYVLYTFARPTAAVIKTKSHISILFLTDPFRLSLRKTYICIRDRDFSATLV